MAGSWRAAALAVAMVCWAASSCMLGFPEEDLVGRLPGQPIVGFRQFAGYVDVDDKAGRSLFYYFAEAQDHAAGRPLTLWLNGGQYLLAGYRYCFFVFFSAAHSALGLSLSDLWLLSLLFLRPVCRAALAFAPWSLFCFASELCSHLNFLVGFERQQWHALPLVW